MSGRGSDSAASGGQGSPGWRELLQEAAGGLQAAGARISRWVEEHQDGIEDVAAGLMAIAVLQPKLAELERRFGESEWAYLIERLDFVNGVAMMLALSEPGSEGTRDAAVDFLEQALSEPQFIAATTQRLPDAPLSPPQRQQLTAGLGHVERREYELAVPLMIVALEGAFAEEAERRDLVRRVKTKLRFTEASGKTGYVGGAEEIFKVLGLDEDLLSFLHRQVYGGHGNAFRHGVARSGFRQKALTLTIALVALLDIVEEDDGTLLMEAFGRQEQAQEIMAAVMRGYMPAPGQ
jgi:hypothetical protein